LATHKKLLQFTSPKHPARRIRKAKEFLIEILLFLAAASSVLVTIGIVWTLVTEALPFFNTVSLKTFLTDTEWTPLFENARYGILPLLCGTLLTTIVALFIAIPLGTVIASLLSEYMQPRWRELLKPLLEILAAVPTVVYGYFALMFIAPKLQILFPTLGAFSILSAGLVMGFMIIPYVSSLSEDALRSVPQHLREGSMALGATRVQTLYGVLIPAAFSGMTSAYVLAISRAFGETMVVAIAAGMQPNLTMSIFEPAATITAFIVQVSMGDLPHGSIGYQSIYVAGLTLLFFTFMFNILGLWLKRKFQEKE
jgi:phosphate transport system permease protein